MCPHREGRQGEAAMVAEGFGRESGLHPPHPATRARSVTSAPQSALPEHGRLGKYRHRTGGDLPFPIRLDPEMAAAGTRIAGHQHALAARTEDS
jgi:hypothetical protein